MSLENLTVQCGSSWLLGITGWLQHHRTL